MTAPVSGQAALFDGADPIDTLRPYQRDDLNRILGCLQRGVRGTLYTLPTGGGKTVVVERVVDTVSRMGWPTWFFVHRRELLQQASRRFAAAGIAHGLVAADAPLTDELVQVASIDTVASRLESLMPRLARVRLGSFDEAHHVPAGRWERVIAALTRAQRLGVTATPFRLDGKGLGTHFDEAVKGPSIRDLIDGGYLSEPHVYAPAHAINLSGVRTVRGDYAAGDLARVVDNDELTLATVRNYARLCPGVPAIVFCAGVEHARHVAERFSAAGWAAASVDGGMSTRERDRAILDLAEDRLQVLTSCEIISEGTDVPVVGAAILLRPTQSTGLFLQQVGRALRPYPGKDCAYILDMVGNVARHGMPDAPRRWSLDGGLRREERAVTATRRCRTCMRVCAVGPDRCPTCRQLYPAKRSAVADTRLATLRGIAGRSATDIAAMRLDEILPLAKTLADLQQVARIKGYPEKWPDQVLAHRARTVGCGRAA